MPHICYYFEANKLRVHEIDVLYIALPSIQFIVNVYGLLVTNILQESQRGLNLCYNNKLLEKVSLTVCAAVCSLCNIHCSANQDGANKTI